MSKSEVWHIAEIVLAAKKRGRPTVSDMQWLAEKTARIDYFLTVLGALR